MQRNIVFDFIDSMQKSDWVVALMVVTTLSFHDKVSWMLVFQIGAFFVEVIIMNIMSNKRHIMQVSGLKQYVTWETAFVVFCALSAIWAHQTKTIQSSVISILQVTMTGITVIFYCDRRGPKNMMIFICIACVILLIRIMVLVPPNAWGDGTRIGTKLGGHRDGGYGNTGITYVLSLGSVIPLYVGYQTKRKKYYVIFALFTLFSVLSGSKKAVIIFAILLISLAFFSSKNFEKSFLQLIVAVVLIIVAWNLIMHIPSLYKVVGSRMEAMIRYFSGGEGDSSTVTRAQYWNDALELFKKNPLVGIGIDGFRFTNRRHGWAENNYLELLADIGAIGTFIYYVFPGMIFFKNLNRASEGHRDGMLILLLLVCLFFIDTTMVSYRNDVLQFYLAFAISLHYIRESGRSVI